MTRHSQTDAVLPDPLLRLLDGERLEQKVGVTFALITQGEDGWPHVALLSVGELFAPTAGELRIALWPGTRTTANLRRAGRATLAAVVEGSVYYAYLEAEPLQPSENQGDSLARFRAGIHDVRSDRVDYADITSGIRFSLRDPDRVVAHWRGVVDSLKA